MKKLIEEIRLQLGDVDGLGYPEELLVRFINDAMCEIAKQRPERFTKPMTMKAQRGEIQCVGACCDKLVAVNGVVDCHGNPIGSTTESSTKLARAFDKKPMTGVESNYTFNLINEAENLFEVHPPIKPSEDVYFRILCVSKPKAMTIDDEFEDCTFHELITHYVLYKAYYMESESQTSIALGDRHVKIFYELLKLERKMDREDDRKQK